MAQRRTKRDRYHGLRHPQRLPLEPTAVRRLRKAGLIEGRTPNVHVSAAVATATSSQAKYIRMRGQDDAFYEQLVTDFLRKFKSATRHDVDDLFLDKLGERPSTEQKAKKIGHIMTRLRRSGKVRNDGFRKAPKWIQCLRYATGGENEGSVP